MLDLIQNLINEHGSSTILRERLQLISDKYDILEEKNGQLIEERRDLVANLKKAETEIDRLRQAIAEYESDNGVTLNDATAKVLELLFEAESAVTKESIGGRAGLDASMVSYHFDVLREHGYLHQASVGRRSSGYLTEGGSSYQPPTYRITPHGRIYVVEVLRR